MICDKCGHNTVCGYIYCHNCKFNNISEEESRERYDYYACDNCHRKSMGWELSYDTAEEIAKKILEVQNEK